MKRSLCFLVVITIVLSGIYTARAEVKVGAAPAMVSFTVDDPDGDTETVNAAVPWALAAVYDLDNKARIYTTATYFDFNLDADTDAVGQDITGYQLSCAYQRIIKLSYSFQFYLGAGVVYTSTEFENRYTVDDDGYLADRFEDREENIFSAIVDISNEWELNDSIDIGFNISYQHALQDDGMSGLMGAVTCFYKFK